MMHHFDIWFLAFALAMDCFTISFGYGVALRRMGRRVWLMALLFGLFQALMPVIGWLGLSCFGRYMQAVDHWVAFVILLFLGGKMIYEGHRGMGGALGEIRPAGAGLGAAGKAAEGRSAEVRLSSSELRRTTSESLHMMLILAVATSIDALAVGFTFAGMGVGSSIGLAYPLGAIGLVSFVMTLVGRYLGVRVGRRVHFPAEYIGGVILIIIGAKVLIQHLMT